jgi:hypothetical protein
MPIRFRKRIALPGPLWLNLSRRWPPSLTVKVGPFSWNTRRRRGRVDLPGPFSYETKDRL